MSFQSLDKIKGHYKDAFGNDIIKGILDDVSLLKLFFIRNVLLHKAGIVDKKFLDRVASIAWTVDAELNKQLPINGALVRDLINPAIKLAGDLIAAVDEQIAPDAPLNLPNWPI